MTRQNQLNYCFITGWDNLWRNLKLRAKYALMKIENIVYPDVFCIPFWLGGKCKFVATGQKINVNHYDFIFAELNAGLSQLAYLSSLIKTSPEKIVVLPGAPEIFEAYADPQARTLAGQVLRNAGQVWAFSYGVADFADSYAQEPVAKIIPWPFDYAGSRRLAVQNSNNSVSDIRILIGAPLRFVGIAANAPAFLEECLAQALDEITPQDRVRFKFYGLVYTGEDRAAWHRTGFGQKIRVIHVPRTSYVRFLRFVGSCHAVLNLPSFSVLGRITFIAAALGKPGIFTANVELNRRLYPYSLVPSYRADQLREAVRDLLLALVNLRPIEGFLPDVQAAQTVGDFVGNAARVREMLSLFPVAVRDRGPEPLSGKSNTLSTPGR